MTTKVAGAGFLGEKLVGNIDFFTLTVFTEPTVGMPFFNTGVVATRDELVEAGTLNDPVLSATNSITITNPTGAFGDKANADTVYTGNTAYDLAYAQQRNLDLLIETISQKAQPILMSDTSTKTLTSNDFLGGTDGTDEATDFRFAVEHTAVFADVPVGAGNPLASDLKAVGLTELLDDLGDKLRTEGAEPSGLNTWNSDVGGNADNFAVVFSGSL
ncbi:hypothetical protein LCGC14_1895290 [marine sediment metagenome]|uniref:Uncharacterized protein n=1 Tax=marine sediment metagenome TaxID=412755 RepID=A0A0F9IWC8_9ZZZZ